MNAALRTLAAALLLTGCPYLGESRYGDEIRDYDGDGVEGTRFGGDDCRDDDKTVKRCDADGDGVLAVEYGGTDCDDGDALVFPGADEICNGVDDDCDGAVDDADEEVLGAPTWYADDDADGYGAADEALIACEAPPNHVEDDRDCDDDRADVHPGAVEFCDAVDRDCNGDPTANAVDPVDWYADADADGFGFGPSIALACEGPTGTADNAEDCDDSSDLAFPGAVEVWYDGVDSDCDGASDFDQDGDGVDRMPEGTDCDDLDGSRFPGALEVCNGGVDDDCDGVADNDDDSVDVNQLWTYHLDADGDGFGSEQITDQLCPNTGPAGWLLLGGDCDDSLDSVLPGGTEVCDNRDNDCDGVVDDGAVGMVDYYVDGDGDGYGGDTIQPACNVGPGLSAVTGDCNDADPLSYPGAPEICGDLFRQDCSALSIYDCDSDGYEDIANGGQDCDDTRADVSPAASEVCDGADNDCDLLIDSDDPSVDLATAADWYTDADGDGFGGPFLQIPSACAPIPGAAANSDDCDDGDPNTYPGAVERCDGVDNTCEGTVDEGPVLDAPTFHYDGDGDGFGDPLLVSTQGCEAPGPEWVLDDTDCADGYASVNPLATEVCDGLDNDCDGLTDAADPGAAITVWYLDDDGDGYGQTGTTQVQCSQPMGYAELADDCNDFDATVNPGAAEICDGGLDNDCDGLGDANDPDLQDDVTWYLDGDGDGYGDGSVSLVQCSQPAGYVTNDLDCDDASASISPAAIELCDGLDNDCDQAVDDADPGVVGAPFWFADVDGDGFGDANSGTRACDQPVGLLPQAGDCDDLDDGVFPGAAEVCDGVDNDCDGDVDAADSNPQLLAWYRDADGDGAGDPTVVTFDCVPPGATWVATADDCDDADGAVNPGAAELCNFLDDDCDGQVDDDDPGVTGQPSWYADADGDGYGAPGAPVIACEVGPGFVANSNDCDDSSTLANPGNTLEFCNGVDDNCDGFVDDQDLGVVDGVDWYPDGDGDGYGDGTAPSQLACTQPMGMVADDSDCDDGDTAVNPAATEVCDGGVDNDCDGAADAGDVSLQGGVIGWFDGDGDGQGNAAVSETVCTYGGDWVANSDDCDDTDGTVGQGFPELCDGVDNDCSGAVDDSAIDAQPWYPDADADGYGDPNTVILECDPGPGWVLNQLDCDDGRTDVNPDGNELCDSLDNDCDGLTDYADPDVLDPSTFYEDGDLDGWGDPSLTLEECFPPFGFVSQVGDCDDSDPSVNPGAQESCDGIDNDCDGLLDGEDEALLDGIFLFEDADGDNYGAGPQVERCNDDEGSGWVGIDGDCNDTDAAIYPSAPEICDGWDNDCNGLADMSDGGVQAPSWYSDFDGDGYGDPLTGVAQCTPPFSSVDNALDCDDTDQNINPDAVEVCDNGVDNDCDGRVDDQQPGVVGTSPFYPDSDQDGYGDASVSVALCAVQPGQSATPGDCDDGDPALYPGQTLTVTPAGGSWNSIQGAMTSACADGVIRVTAGTYAEQLDFQGKRLTVRGADPNNPPLLQAPVSPAIAAVSGERVGTAVEDLQVQVLADGGGDGGGARVAFGSSLDLRRVSFDGISIAGNGAGVSVVNGVATIESCSFADNQAPRGAHVFVNAAEALVVDTVFENGLATFGEGGALWVVGGVVDVVGSDFTANQAPGAGSTGGAIAGLGVGTVIGVYDSRFEGNTAAGAGGTINISDGSSLLLSGVGIYGGGAVNAVATFDPLDLTVEDSEIIGVTGSCLSATGSTITASLDHSLLLACGTHGLVTDVGSLTADHLTAVGNAGAGAILSNGGGSLTNSILWGNVSDGLFVNSFTGTVDFNLFETPTETTTWGLSNLDGDPLFLTWHPNLDPEAWDLHPSPVGAAADAGTGPLEGDGSAPDIGAYGGLSGDWQYYQDLDADGLLDGWELFWFGDLSPLPTDNFDGDSYTNDLELGFGCNPLNGDTDGDGSSDGVDGAPLDYLAQ